MIFNLSNGPGLMSADRYNYAGSSLLAVDAAGNFSLALLDGSEAVLQFRWPGLVDVFIVGGGQPSTTGGGWATPGGGAYGGRGGHGGCFKTITGIILPRQSLVTIGLSGQSSLIAYGSKTLTSDGGTQITGIAGATESNSAGEVVDGVYAFEADSDPLLFTSEQFEGRRFGAPGGGGGVSIYKGSSQGWTKRSGTLGGESNGPSHDKGRGQSEGSANTAGYDNHGQGGGAPLTYYWVQSSNTLYGDVKSGGSGIILIQNHRRLAA